MRDNQNKGVDTMNGDGRILREFASVQDARDYRHEAGCGGWIFAPDSGMAVLFPPDMSPSDVFHHPIARGRSGELIGSN